MNQPALNQHFLPGATVYPPALLPRNKLAAIVLQIRVFCRVRPHPQSAVKCLAGGTSLALTLDNKEHQFSFDKVFAPGTSQQQVRYTSFWTASTDKHHWAGAAP
eukprot:GHUV01028670.1.p4 GENE.GHUV01028670.1~~GHUV01028670.1.p4  ORF type:complete len:104 (-),score=27.56 GHUV01028670.1:817-1128(-)